MVRLNCKMDRNMIYIKKRSSFDYIIASVYVQYTEPGKAARFF